MAGYDHVIKVKAAYKEDGKKFFKFLRAVGKKHIRPTKFTEKYLGRGRFYVEVDGQSGSIDSILQELILNRGLYYYVCALDVQHKHDVVKYAILPIFQELLEYRFQNPYAKFLKRHILSHVSQEMFVPGDFYDPFSHEYEILFRKWDIGALDNRSFIHDLDALLTRFMLTKIRHPQGDHSPAFNKLVNIAYNSGLGMASEIKGLFNKVHTERTTRLHRLKSNLSDEDLSSVAFQIYNYFQFFDEFQESQKEKTDKLHGKKYRRIKYGDEQYPEMENWKSMWTEVIKSPCHDCAAIRGQYHCSGCDVEQCPRCKGQRLGCGCKLKKDWS